MTTITDEFYGTPGPDWTIEPDMPAEVAAILKLNPGAYVVVHEIGAEKRWLVNGVQVYPATPSGSQS